MTKLALAQGWGSRRKSGDSLDQHRFTFISREYKIHLSALVLSINNYLAWIQHMFIRPYYAWTTSVSRQTLQFLWEALTSHKIYKQAGRRVYEKLTASGDLNCLKRGYREKSVALKNLWRWLLRKRLKEENSDKWNVERDFWAGLKRMESLWMWEGRPPIAGVSVA